MNLFARIHAHRDQHSFPTRRSSDLSPLVIGISGSVGKTSTKEAIFTVLAKKYRVRKSEKSFNTEKSLRSEEHTSELQSLTNIVCRLLLEKKNGIKTRAMLARVQSGS